MAGLNAEYDRVNIDVGFDYQSWIRHRCTLAISAAIRALLNTENVVVNRPAVDAGLAPDAGGDFADGSIAYDGSWLGGETFVSFDRKAIKLLCALGQSSRLLS